MIEVAYSKLLSKKTTLLLYQNYYPVTREFCASNYNATRGKLLNHSFHSNLRKFYFTAAFGKVKILFMTLEHNCMEPEVDPRYVHVLSKVIE